MSANLRRAAEDLRDGATKFAAAVIAGRLDDAAYTLNALLRDAMLDVEREMGRIIIASRKRQA